MQTITQLAERYGVTPSELERIFRYNGINPDCKAKELWCYSEDIAVRIPELCESFRTMYTGMDDMFPGLVEKRGECWVWLGGYRHGRYTGGPRRYLGSSAVHLAYDYFVHPVKRSQALNRTCSTPRCVSPWHHTRRRKKRETAVPV